MGNNYKKSRHILWPFGVFLPLGWHCGGFFDSFLWALHPLAGPRSVPPGGKSPMAGPGQGWMTKDHCRGMRAPISLQLTSCRWNLSRFGSRKHNLRTKMYCNQAPSIPPSGLFLLEKEQNNFRGFSHTDTKLATLPPPPQPQWTGIQVANRCECKNRCLLFLTRSKFG